MVLVEKEKRLFSQRRACCVANPSGLGEIMDCWVRKPLQRCHDPHFCDSEALHIHRLRYFPDDNKVSTSG